MLKSDNPQFAPYTVPDDRLVEVWKAVGDTSFELPAAGTGQEMSQIMHMRADLKKEMNHLKDN